jgi:hypothetical protein
MISTHQSTFFNSRIAGWICMKIYSICDLFNDAVSSSDYTPSDVITKTNDKLERI